MQFLNLTTLKTCTLADIQSANPRTSFHLQLADSELIHFGYAVLHSSEFPAYDAKTQGLVEDTPKLLSGQWWQQWSVVELELAVSNANLSQFARAKRDQLLLDSDKYVLADRWGSMDEQAKLAWTGYRQSLRDIPNQPSFPNNVSWPNRP